MLAAACEPSASSPIRRPLSTPDGGPGCGTVPYEGCCIGQSLAYCAGTQVMAKPCDVTHPCGWSVAFGMYTCGGGVPADPSGTFARDCNVDLGVPSSDAPAPADAQPSDGAGCGPLGLAGCCEGEVVYFCSGSQVLSLDCSGQPSCGWNGASGYYDCNTSGAPETSGAHPMSCSAVLGDSGVPLDSGGGDAPPDLGVGDLALDVGDASSRDIEVPGDARPRDAAGDGAAEVGAGEGGIGLDASGLDVSGLDGGEIKPSGGGGCSGCAVRRSPGAPSGGLWLTLGLLALALARRRASW